ncbi:hypothetical protein RhiirC2_794395 [Rhizophagus irregularis]|uniref:Uncharacterized protein n=1 Tax=Rhizophagus irregularis TaxID=588596 RepID=A0A2N1MDL6_9GLOM|nr:hypothetical protein RhiirC2_794395 [Rhizophagus irregularis]
MQTKIIIKKKKNAETVEHVDKRRKTDESADELINEALTKILRQNIKILSKLDIIISNQKALENRVSKVEESVDKNSDNNQGDEEYIKKIIKEVAKKLLEVSIYPTPDELREFTNNYMNENYDDFIKRFKRYDKWIIFYEKNIASPLLDKHRSAWGSLASKVKDIMYVIFKEFNLPTIPAVNTALKESEIRKWKGSPTVKICYSNLFKKIKNPDPETYMSRILQILKGRNQLSNMQIAYAISICEIILNPKNLHIQVTESVIKPVLTKNLKKITTEEVDEVEEEADEAEEVLQEKKKNEIREEDEKEGGRIYISSMDEETKERMRQLKKQYKK